MHFSLAPSLAALVYAGLAGAQARAGTRCGNTQYSATDVDRASTAACGYVRDGGHAGSSTYPHEYRNFEGFEFHGLEPPFYEFPILSSKRVYGGGRPGPDRVIITEDCRQAGQLTHTGAGGNNFLTGATGFIGFRVLVQLLEAGYRVRTAVRNRAGFERISTLKPVSPHASRLDCIIVADMTAPAAYDEAVEGVKYMIHVASPTSQGGRNSREYGSAFVDPAVKGTVGLLESANRIRGTQRVVVTGTAGSMGSVKTAFDDVMVNEQSPIMEPDPIEDDLTAYAASKTYAFRAANKFMAETKPPFDLIHIMPAVVLGRDDTATNARDLVRGTNAVLMGPLLGYAVKFPLAGTVVHVDDVAKMHVAALDPKVEGNQIFMGAPPPMGRMGAVNWAKAIDIVKRRYPKEYKQGLLGVESTSNMREMPARVDGTKAQRVFGFTFKTFEEQADDYRTRLLDSGGVVDENMDE